ncbi:MAG: hypothetical protein ABFS56_33860 [Pseudomonadota bacterium]
MCRTLRVRGRHSFAPRGNDKKYVGIKHSRIQTILDEWRAFLCVDQDEDKCLCYRFYHDSFRYFLAKLETVKEECVDLKAANKEFADVLDNQSVGIT